MGNSTEIGSFGNVVRDGDKVMVHSASGLDFEVPTLKSIHLQGKWQNKNAAMFIAANVEIFGVLIGIIVVLIVIVYFARRKR